MKPPLSLFPIPTVYGAVRPARLRLRVAQSWEKISARKPEKLGETGEKEAPSLSPGRVFRRLWVQREGRMGGAAARRGCVNAERGQSGL